MRNAIKTIFRWTVEHSPWGERFFWRLRRGAGRVALTFDDGPDPLRTPRLLDLLAAHGAHATFFVVGTAAERHPELIRRIIEEGHSLGNHTHCHARCDGLPWPGLQAELERTDRAIAAAFCAEPDGAVHPVRLFRPPFGRLPFRYGVRLVLGGRRVVFWNRDSRDYRGATAEQVAALGPTLRDGDVLLFHDRFAATVEALPALLQCARERGLACVALEAGPAVGESVNTGRVRVATRRAPV